MNWGFLVFTQVVIALAVLGLIGWSAVVVVRSLTNKNRK